MYFQFRFSFYNGIFRDIKVSCVKYLHIIININFNIVVVAIGETLSSIDLQFY
jgi:hypothetical protein